MKKPVLWDEERGQIDVYKRQVQYKRGTGLYQIGHVGVGRGGFGAVHNHKGNVRLLTLSVEPDFLTPLELVLGIRIPGGRIGRDVYKRQTLKRQAFSKKSGKDAPRRRLSYEHKKSLYGYGFISLWLVGFLLFFLRPFVSVIIYSLSKIEYLDTGHRLVFRGLDNFRRALLEDPDIIRMMADSIKDIPVTVITIVIVSLAIAVVLNRKFFGRTAVRAIFFVLSLINICSWEFL